MEITRTVESPPFAPVQQVYAKQRGRKKLSAGIDVVGLMIGPLGICLLLLSMILMYVAVNPKLAAAAASAMGLKRPKCCRRRKKQQKSPDDVQGFEDDAEEENEDEESDDEGGGCCSCSRRSELNKRKTRITLRADVLKEEEESKAKMQRSTMWIGNRPTVLSRKTPISSSLFKKKSPKKPGN